MKALAGGLGHVKDTKFKYSDEATKRIMERLKELVHEIQCVLLPEDILDSRAMKVPAALSKTLALGSLQIEAAVSGAYNLCVLADPHLGAPPQKSGSNSKKSTFVITVICVGKVHSQCQPRPGPVAVAAHSSNRPLTPTIFAIALLQQQRPHL